MAEGTNSLSSQPSTERSSGQIRQDIAAKRDSISRTVDNLGERVHETLDWREQVGRHPYAALAAAAGVGLLLSAWFRPRATPWERISDAIAETVEDVSGDLRHSAQRVVMKAAGPGIVKGVIGAAVTKAAVDFFKNKVAENFVPNTQRQYR